MGVTTPPWATKPVWEMVAGLGTCGGLRRPQGRRPPMSRKSHLPHLCGSHTSSYVVPGAPEDPNLPRTRRRQTFTLTAKSTRLWGATDKTERAGAPGKGFEEATFQLTHDHSERAIGDVSPRTFQAESRCEGLKGAAVGHLGTAGKPGDCSKAHLGVTRGWIPRGPWPGRSRDIILNVTATWWESLEGFWPRREAGPVDGVGSQGTTGGGG